MRNLSTSDYKRMVSTSPKISERCALILGQGVDDLLAKHISHLFIRDPLVIYSELIDQDDATSTNHFEV